LDNILTIDLEEWYHPEYVRNKAQRRRKERITQSLIKSLQLLSEYDVNATFFVVGELVEKHPEIIEKINEKGHEIAFHGYYHEPLWKLNAEILQLEIKKFNSLTREKCLGFRAPSFSLNNETRWALKVLEDAHFIYDSSIFPVKTPLYGVNGAPIEPYNPSHEDVTQKNDSEDLWEFPLLLYPLMGFRIPMAGGFYLRLFPVSLVKRAIKKMNKHGAPAVIYVHNWELDPQTPKLKLRLYNSFVTYYNISKTVKKLQNMLSNFDFKSLREYVETEGLT